MLTVPRYADQSSECVCKHSFYCVSYISDPGIGEFHAMPTNHMNVCKHNSYSVPYISDPGIGELHAMPTSHLNMCKHNRYSVSYISDPGIGEFHAMLTIPPYADQSSECV